jgi:branched chain amino acid efflux pump
MIDVVAAISAVVLLALVTMTTRVGGVWIMSYVTITPGIEAFLKYMSVSVLISIVAATSWAAGSRIWLGVGTAALVMIASRSAVGAMLAGTGLAALARNFGF